MKKSGFGILLAVVALGLQAENLTANWQPTAAGNLNWYDLVNWDTEILPTNRTDTVRFDAAEIAGAQTIKLPAVAGSEWEIGTVWGHANQTIQSHESGTNGRRARRITITNPNNFPGIWSHGDVWMIWTPVTTPEFVPTFQRMDALRRPYFDVRSNRAEIGQVFNGGGLVKQGAGTLTVKGADIDTRGTMRMQVDAGTLELAFTNECPKAEAVAGSYIHLDASRADTLTLHTGEDGRSYVSAWRDCDGGPFSATTHVSSGEPFLSTLSLVDGIPLIDFGAFKGEENKNYAYWSEKLGPAGSLSIPRTTKVREVFLVFEDTQNSNRCPFVVGDDYSYQLHRESMPDSHNGLLSGSFAAAALKNNLAMVDGVARSYAYAQDYTQLSVVSLVATSGVNLSTLCNDRSNLRIGGARLAEVIIYTNELTVAERIQNQYYLRKKWTHRKFPYEDLREVRLANGTSLNVADGLSLTTDLLTVSEGGSVTKTGAGELRVHSLPHDNFNLTVAGGQVNFAKPPSPVTDDAPAADPFMWFDASAVSSLVVTNVEDGTDREYICRWNDRRSEKTSPYAYTRSSDVTFPYLVPNAANGLPVLDFGDGWLAEWGTWGEASGSSARFDVSGAQSSYDGFIVIRPKLLNGYSTTDHAYQNPPLFGTSNQDFTRWGGGAAVAGYGGIGPHAALWEYDGIPTEVRSTAPAWSTNEFTVISFSSGETCAANYYIANDRNIVCGGVQIAETILYTRKLSAAERKSTQAYLMKKWKGKAHPAQAQTLTFQSLTYADGVDPVIETDRNLVVEKYSASGALTVKGTGSVTLPDALEPPTSLSVSGGTLTLGNGDPFADALFHLDASKTESLEYLVAEEDGVATTNVVKWNDVRANGGYALSSPGTGMSVAHPTLNNVETRNGKRMQVIDFGDLNVSGATNPKGTTAAGMEFKKTGWNGALHEAHVVYSDANGGIAHRFIFSDTQYYPCHRGDTDGMLFCNYSGTYSSFVKFGYIALDGVVTPWNYKLTDQQFHVVSIAPTNSLYLRTIMRDRNSRAGGSYQGEYLSFSKPLSANRRKYLQDYLQWKWFGVGDEPQLPVALTSVSLEQNSTVQLPSFWKVSSPTVTGTGSLTVGALADVETLQAGDAVGETGSLAITGDVALKSAADLVFDLVSTNDYDQVTVNGTLTIPTDATITLNVGKGLSNCSGSFPILTATAFAGADLTKLPRLVNNESNRSVALRLQDNTLSVHLLPRATILIFR